MSAAAATSARDAFMPRRPRGLGIGFVLAVLAHVLLVLALAFSVNWHSRQVLGVEAELWSAVPQIAAPRATAPEPPPAPRPRPPGPTPPKPVAKPEPAPPDPQIAIEKAKKEEALREQARQDELQRQKEAREQQQREQAQRDAQERQQREQERKKQQQEAAAQEAARQAYLKRMMGQAGATGDPNSTGTAARTSGPSSNYAGRVAAYIKPRIYFDNSQVNGNPAALVEVRTAPDGHILSRRLLQSSGIPAYDDAVLRAIDNAQVVPRDPNGVPPVMQLTFRPKD